MANGVAVQSARLHDCTLAGASRSTSSNGRGCMPRVRGVFTGLPGMGTGEPAEPPIAHAGGVGWRTRDASQALAIASLCTLQASHLISSRVDSASERAAYALRLGRGHCQSIGFPTSKATGALTDGPAFPQPKCRSWTAPCFRVRHAAVQRVFRLGPRAAAATVSGQRDGGGRVRSSMNQVAGAQTRSCIAQWGATDAPPVLARLWKSARKLVGTAIVEATGEARHGLNGRVSGFSVQCSVRAGRLLEHVGG